MPFELPRRSELARLDDIRKICSKGWSWDHPLELLARLTRLIQPLSYCFDGLWSGIELVQSRTREYS